MSSSSVAAAYSASPPGKAHILLLSIYIAILVGKFGEWIPGLGSIPLAKIAFLLAVVFAYRVRKQLPVVLVRRLPIARPAIYFHALAMISIVFSVYKGGSLAMLYGVAISLLSLILLLKVTQTITDLERLLFGLSVAAAGLSLATIFSYGGGRAQINGNFDPNDLASGLVTILPIIRALAVTATKRRLLLNGLAGATIVAVLLTGSRGAVLALGIEVLLVAAFPLSFARRGGLKRLDVRRFVVVTTAMVGLLAAMWGFLPTEIRGRIATFVDLRDDYNMSSSKDGRSEIWSRDLAAAWRRPIGYGLGSSEYVNGITGGHYRAPHDSFVQASVELGVLGVSLLALSYLSALEQLGLVSGRGRWGTGRWGRAPNDPRAALYARALRVSLVANLVAGLFLSHAYDSLLWIVIAICAALVRIDKSSTAGGPWAAAPT